MSFCDCSDHMLNLINLRHLRTGFSNKLRASCLNCDWGHTFFTSNTSYNSAGTQGRNPFDLNVRTVIALLEIGRGQSAINNYA